MNFVFLFKCLYSLLFLVNNPQELNVNLALLSVLEDYLKCISGINLSLATKIIFTISFILYIKQNAT